MGQKRTTKKERMTTAGERTLTALGWLHRKVNGKRQKIQSESHTWIMHGKKEVWLDLPRVGSLVPIQPKIWIPRTQCPRGTRTGDGGIGTGITHPLEERCCNHKWKTRKGEKDLNKTGGQEGSQVKR